MAHGIPDRKDFSRVGDLAGHSLKAWHVDHAEDLDFSGSSRGRRGISELSEHALGRASAPARREYSTGALQPPLCRTMSRKGGLLYEG